MNAKLASGEDIILSIDLGLQSVVSHEVQKQIHKFEAIGGAGILLDIQTGEMLAVASLPDFNPNHFSLVMMTLALTVPLKASMKWDLPSRC